MWLYSGLSDPDRSSSEELSDKENNTQILKVLDHGANLNHGAGPTPLREWLASTRVSLFVSFLATYAISSSHCTRNLA
jgi:hypothetical protein